MGGQSTRGGQGRALTEAVALMVYLDTSCLLKLLLLEPESAAVRQAVSAETGVVISSLTQLEAEVQLAAGHRGGRYRASQWRAYRSGLARLLDLDPFRLRSLPGTVFATALRQQQLSVKVHCRSLDRLHLAAIEELGLERLMTHDDAQAAAARACGFSVAQPGRA